MEEKRVEVNCLSCQASRIVKLIKTAIGTRIDWLDDAPSEKIVSFRERLDGKFGFQCICGNNDLMTDQEIKTIENPASPTPKEVASIVKDLKEQPMKFKVKEA